MSLYKRGSIYWIKITTPSGKLVRESTGTGDKTQAQEYHDRLKADYWREAKLGEKPDRFWAEAAATWLKERATKASIQTDALRLEKLHPKLGGLRLSQITRARVKEITDEMQASGLSHATLNHYVATVRQILNAASREWEWGNVVPHFKTYPKDNVRYRFGNRDEMLRLLAALPEHLRALATTALATGLRKGTLLQLTWRNVDVVERSLMIEGRIMKGRRFHMIPLNQTAWRVIEAQRGKHDSAIFTFRGAPLRDFNEETLRRACERSGVDDFKFHDFRKTFASWLAKAGVPDRVIKILGAWQLDVASDASLRYIWSDLEALREAVCVIDMELGLAPDTQGTKQAQTRWQRWASQR